MNDAGNLKHYIGGTTITKYEEKTRRQMEALEKKMVRFRQHILERLEAVEDRCHCGRRDSPKESTPSADFDD